MKFSAVLALVACSSVDPAIAQTEGNAGVASSSAGNLTTAHCSSSQPYEAGYFCELQFDNSLAGANGTSTDGYCTTCPKYDNADPMDCLYIQSEGDELEEDNVKPLDLLPSSSKNKVKKQNTLRYVPHKKVIHSGKLCV
jgi:hypothetical protein